MADEEEKAGELCNPNCLVAQYQITRIRFFMPSYKRILQLTNDGIVTLDPSKFTATNTFSFATIAKLWPDEKTEDQLSMEIEKTTYVYKTAHRPELLCQLFECITRKVPTKFKTIGPVMATRLRKNGGRINCKLAAAPYGIVEIDPTNRILQEYRFVNISKIGVDEKSRAFFFKSSGRAKIFFMEDLDLFLNGCKLQLSQLGMGPARVSFLSGQNINDVLAARQACYMATGAPVSVFDVNKFTRRSLRPVPRQMHVTEGYVVEKDASGFQFVSFQKITAIYALIRSWENPREFTIEYDDGTSRTYTCGVRDTLLAIILDIAQSLGNVRVIVTGQVSDSLRLMPRFAEEQYKARIQDAFFGANSIEAWFLNRLANTCKALPFNVESIELACRELNANVPCPGIDPASDGTQVKICLTGVLKSINAALLASFNNDRIDNSHTIALMLQTLYRIIPCVHGYKGFVEVREVDTRMLLLQLIRNENDFVNYWTLEVLQALCRCPLKPRNTQQEFINKHTLLSDHMLTCLIELMSARIDAPEDEAEEDEEEAEEEEGEDAVEPDAEVEGSQQEAAVIVEKPKRSKKAVAPTPPQPVSPVEPVPAPSGKKKAAVAPNPTATAHLPSMGPSSDSKTGMDTLQRRQAEVTETIGEGQFFPNSLVIVAAASLLESIVSSQRDTSSPELLHKVLDLLCQRCEVLVHMLRSTSFLIMENAAILMFVLLKNRPNVSVSLREMALSECLVLKHFYNGVFSPSATQRFISRFLIATWMSGAPKANPGKAMLTRMIPTGLVEYLKHTPINEEHRKNLDEMEEDFYANFGAAMKNQKSSTNSELQQRMRKRITAALKEHAVERTMQKSLTAVDGSNEPIQQQVSQQHEPAVEQPVRPRNTPENYRIMFHVMTQDHRLPDLIWNEQTRLELRSTLESEIKEFEKEQRLRGAGKIAWNFQQFYVKYDSLKEEMQVGPIYVRHFLDAGDAFLRSLENPSHVVLFEKLFRRVLVNVESNPRISILCTKCLCRLYEVCRDIIGDFDDMLLVVRMLEKAPNMELQHCLIDLMEVLCLEHSNLLQLLDREFVDVIIKYATLAHINPDQIGNVLARATANTLLLKESGETGHSRHGEDEHPHTSPKRPYTPGGPGMDDADITEEEKGFQQTRSMWCPDDISCPRTWFVAPKGVMPPPLQSQKGPFRVSELLAQFDRGQLDDSWLVAPSSLEDLDEDRFEAIVDTGKWKPLREYFQLKLQMLFPGKAVYGPAEIASKSLKMLASIASVHKSANLQGVPFFPIPTSKRIMSDPHHLTIFSQLLLANDAAVVEIAAQLLKSLVELNPHANSKLYLSGAFFFACRYSGNNFIHIARLFDVTHLKQSFHDAQAVARDLPLGVRSMLGNIFPTALIAMLVNYGAERFSAVFTGDYDTPEVIWNADLRRHVVEMIDQHIGNFAARLRQFTMARYDYCPIPKIHFATLDRELYVHEYYLRNLCDEKRFPAWPIADPLTLLRETIQRWREEMSKGVVDNSVSEAKKLLGLSERFDNKDLRKAYKNLARQYHPDKNPNGREMFEKIHVAYELLSSVELHVTETDMTNVVLLMKTQNIIYRRFAEDVSDQKYPAYPLLISVLVIPAVEPPVTGTDAELLLVGTMLMYYTCNISPLNAKEFVKAGAVVKLHEIVQYALKAIEVPETKEMATNVLIYAMKAFTAVSQFETGRECLLSLCPQFAEDMHKILAFDHAIPLAVENCMELISRCSSLEGLQQAFINAGVIWKLIPMLLSYDGTLQEDYVDESQRAVFNQSAANMHAVIAGKTLGRLGGYMFDELATPVNEHAKKGLSSLLTPPLAKLLRNRRPWELLGALNENVEKATKIWNVGMRKELLDFVVKTDSERPPGSRENDLDPALNFVFTALRDELCVGGVYVRIFNKTGETNDIDDPSQFCIELLNFSWTFMCYEIEGKGNEVAVRLDHQEYAVEGLRTLAESHDYIAVDVAKSVHGIDIAFALIRRPSETAIFASAAQFLSILCSSPDFVAIAVQHKPSITWRLLCALCTASGAAVSHVWTAADGMAAHPEGLNALIEAGGVAHLLGAIFGVKGYVNVYASRLAAISLLSKFLWNPVRGAEASAMLRRFLPEPVVVLLRSKAGSASLKVLDDVVENPELIWTAEMQGELRVGLTKLLIDPVETKEPASKSLATPKGPPPSAAENFRQTVEISPEYSIPYRQLSFELYVGGVYIRLYLKQPTFQLSNPIFFAEKLIEFWESSFNVQVPLNNSKPIYFNEKDAESREVVLGKEDFLTLITSCIICVVKGEGSVVDHLLSWGFAHTLAEYLKRALDGGRRGVPVTCVVRLLHQLVSRTDTVDNLSSAPVDLMSQLTRAIDINSNTPGSTPEIPKEAAFTVELMKKIFQSVASRSLGFYVASAMQANLPNFLLDHIIGASKQSLANVRNSSALRIHAVEVLKAMINADPENAGVLQTLLDVHPSWEEFRDQSHDLFITDQEKTDHFLLEDASETKFAGLLTDGSEVSGISKYFTSNTTATSGGGGNMGFAAPGSVVPPAPVAKAAAPRPAVRPVVATAAVNIPPTPPQQSQPQPLKSAATAPAAAPPSTSTSSTSQPATTGHSRPVPPAAAARARAPAAAPAAPGPAVAPTTSSQAPKPSSRQFQTKVTKGPHGIGLDLTKTADGGISVTRFKEMPDGSVNPASLCNPPIQAGDKVVGVNGKSCVAFSDAVAAMRAATGVITLTLER